MKKMISILIILAGIFGIGYLSSMYYSKSYNDAGRNNILALNQLLEESKKLTGSYPLALDDLTGYEGIVQKKFFSPFFHRRD